jgi:transcription antitermination factor NusG
VFCRFDPQHKVPVLRNPAVDYVVEFGNGPVPIPDEEIEAIRLALSMGAVPTEYLKVGQRVRVLYGPLVGTEGILTRTSNRDRLVLSIDMIQRSVALHIDADMVEPI